MKSVDNDNEDNDHDERRSMDISSPCEPNGSGELIIDLYRAQKYDKSYEL